MLTLFYKLRAAQRKLARQDELVRLLVAERAQNARCMRSEHLLPPFSFFTSTMKTN